MRTSKECFIFCVVFHIPATYISPWLINFSKGYHRKYSQKASVMLWVMLFTVRAISGSSGRESTHQTNHLRVIPHFLCRFPERATLSCFSADEIWRRIAVASLLFLPTRFSPSQKENPRRHYCVHCSFWARPKLRPSCIIHYVPVTLCPCFRPGYYVFRCDTEFCGC